MVYKRFRIVVLSRVLLLSASIYLFFYLLLKPDIKLYATIFILGMIILYQVYTLIHYVEKTNRDLNRFLQTIKHEDFSQTFLGSGLGSSFDELKTVFNEIIHKFQQTRAEKEEHFRYLQTVVQHIGIGLIVFQMDGRVELMNTAAKRLLRVPSLRNVRELESFSKPLVKSLLRLKSGQKTLVKVYENNEILHLAIYATEFKIRGRNFTLVSLQNIQSELEEKELESWQNLIRVLSHEIMNSVTPIASLASTVKDIIEASGAQYLSRETSSESKSDIQSALQTIEKRSQGLLHFVDAYRNLTHIPKPSFQIFPIVELFERVHQLMHTQISDNGINFQLGVNPQSLELTADPELIEQVLINLLLNAVEAVKNLPEAKIDLTARMDVRGRIIIQVIDNGPGIPEDVLDKIFIPFFTTKEEGSGIGLSLSRQIMRLHRGVISVQSKPNEETVFTLRF